MLKLTKRLLALSVSVVLSSTVLLAGCGKVEGDADDKPVKADSIGDSAEMALNTVGNTAQNIQDMFTGKSDRAYSSKIKLSIGKPLAKEMGLDKIEDIVFTSDVKAKKGNVQTLLGLKYGKDELVSADIVRDEETGNVYFGCEQLSPGYLYISGSDIDAYIEEFTEEMLYEFDVNDMDEVLEQVEIPEIDFDEIEDQLGKYEDAIKDNMPKGKDKDKVTGEIDGVKYSLDCKSYTFSGNDAVNIVSAVVDELKKDETVLSLIEEYGEAEGVTKQDFIDELDDMVSELKDSDDLDNTIDFDVYYQGDNFAGISFTNEDSGTYYTSTESVDMFWYSTDKEMCGKFEFIDKYDDSDWSYDDTMLMSCSAKLDSNGTDFSAKIEVDDASMSFKIEDFQIVDEESGAFTGSVEFSMTVDDESFVIKGESKSTSKKLDLSASMSYNGEEYLSVSITGEETKATDVSIPKGDVYNANDSEQLEAYAATIDTEKFQEDIKDSLGEDLYDAMFPTYDHYYDDWDYDYEDYDWYDYDDDYNNWGTGTVVADDYWV